MIVTVLTLIVAFGLVWVGSGLVVGSLSRLAQRWQIPSFVLSFFVLGLLTSIPELTIGTVAVLEGKPEIMVGNLLGGVIVMLLAVIPLLGLLGNGIKLPSKLHTVQYLFVMAVIATPVLLLIDGNLTNADGLVMIFLYALLLLVFSFRQPWWERMQQRFQQERLPPLTLMVKILVGVACLIGSSHLIVNEVSALATALELNTFVISVLLVAVGSNIPELSLVVRSLFSHKTEVAFADYLGSASANTLLLGLFTVFGRSPLVLDQLKVHYFVFLLLGLGLFTIFIRSEKKLSRLESAFLLLLYLCFVFFELR